MPPIRDLPDIVRDSQIPTSFNGPETEHIFFESGRSLRQRRVRRDERWLRDVELGRGGYGTVYKERRLPGIDGSSALRAVKVISKKVLETQGVDYTRELEAVLKFSHDNYAHCFVKSNGWFESPDSIFIWMEYFEHGDLQKHLRQPMPEIEAKRITNQILEGLSYMHENGFVHRDLKPGNIMVVSTGPDWFVKIADFGISKRRRPGATMSQTMQRGSLGFAAPEVLGWKPTRTADDVTDSQPFAIDMWSLGAVTFYLVSKALAFDNPGCTLSYAMGQDKFPEQPLLDWGFSEKGRAFIKNLLEAAPAGRPTVRDAANHEWLVDPDVGHLRLNVEPPSPGVQIDTLPLSQVTSSPPSAAWTCQTVSERGKNEATTTLETKTSMIFGATTEVDRSRRFQATVEDVADEYFLQHVNNNLEPPSEVSGGFPAEDPIHGSHGGSDDTGKQRGGGNFVGRPQAFDISLKDQSTSRHQNVTSAIHGQLPLRETGGVRMVSGAQQAGANENLGTGRDIEQLFLTDPWLRIKRAYETDLFRAYGGPLAAPSTSPRALSTASSEASDTDTSDLQEGPRQPQHLDESDRQGKVSSSPRLGKATAPSKTRSNFIFPKSVFGGLIQTGLGQEGGNRPKSSSLARFPKVKESPLYRTGPNSRDLGNKLVDIPLYHQASGRSGFYPRASARRSAENFILNEHLRQSDRLEAQLSTDEHHLPGYGETSSGAYSHPSRPGRSTARTIYPSEAHPFSRPPKAVELPNEIVYSPRENPFSPFASQEQPYVVYASTKSPSRSHHNRQYVSPTHNARIENERNLPGDERFQKNVPRIVCGMTLNQTSPRGRSHREVDDWLQNLENDTIPFWATKSPPLSNSIPIKEMERKEDEDEDVSDDSDSRDDDDRSGYDEDYKHMSPRDLRRTWSNESLYEYEVKEDTKQRGSKSRAAQDKEPYRGLRRTWSNLTQLEFGDNEVDKEMEREHRPRNKGSKGKKPILFH